MILSCLLLHGTEYYIVVYSTDHPELRLLV